MALEGKHITPAEGKEQHRDIRASPIVSNTKRKN
jgi:hypothetical protein